MVSSQGELTAVKEVERNMTQGLGTSGVSPASLRLWMAERRMQTGPLSVLSESQPESGLDALACNDGFSLTSQHRDGRKRKELLDGPSEEESGALDHKRHRNAQLQSSTSSSYGSVMTSRTDVLNCDAIAERQGSCLLSVQQPVFEKQVRPAGVLGLAVVDTSCWSSDCGHDESSGGNASAFISGEVGDSQLHQPLGRFLNVDWKGGASVDPNGRADMHMWSHSGGLLSLQLDSFIEKEKKKLESFDTAGSGTQIVSESEQSLLGSLYGVHSSCLQRRLFEKRSTGSDRDIGSYSMEDEPCFLAGSDTEASNVKVLELNPVTSMLLSRISKRQRSALEFCCTEDSAISVVEDQGEEDRKRKLTVRKLCTDSMDLQGSVYDLKGVPLSVAENVRMQDEGGMKPPDLHQTFVLSSGRPSSSEEAWSSKPMLTIDCDFDTYFSKLML